MKTSYVNSFSLVGKTAIVTGGAGFLGQHFCSGLADVGVNVVVFDINMEAAQKAAISIQSVYGRAYCSV
jgi:nucleoside-diphosphate-sugar epimerase